MSTAGLTITSREPVSLDDVLISDSNRKQLLQLIRENRHLSELRKYNLQVSNKILLHGSSGCGKTYTAKAIATALKKKLIIVSLSTLVNSRIGETAKNLNAIFDKAKWDKAVLFLDEFDHIGVARDFDEKDVGEMRRLVNTLIQLIDYLPEEVIMVAATNHLDFIDSALLRRFQLRLEYTMPDQKSLDVYYDQLLSAFPQRFRNMIRKYEISYAEAKDEVQTAVKRSIIEELEQHGAEEV